MAQVPVLRTESDYWRGLQGLSRDQLVTVLAGAQTLAQVHQEIVSDIFSVEVDFPSYGTRGPQFGVAELALTALTNSGSLSGEDVKAFLEGGSATVIFTIDPENRDNLRSLDMMRHSICMYSQGFDASGCSSDGRQLREPVRPAVPFEVFQLSENTYALVNNFFIPMPEQLKSEMKALLTRAAMAPDQLGRGSTDEDIMGKIVFLLQANDIFASFAEYSRKQSMLSQMRETMVEGGFRPEVMERLDESLSEMRGFIDKLEESLRSLIQSGQFSPELAMDLSEMQRSVNSSVSGFASSFSEEMARPSHEPMRREIVLLDTAMGGDGSYEGEVMRGGNSEGFVEFADAVQQYYSEGLFLTDEGHRVHFSPLESQQFASFTQAYGESLTKVRALMTAYQHFLAGEATEEELEQLRGFDAEMERLSFTGGMARIYSSRLMLQEWLDTDARIRSAQDAVSGFNSEQRAIYERGRSDWEDEAPDGGMRTDRFTEHAPSEVQVPPIPQGQAERLKEIQKYAIGYIELMISNLDRASQDPQVVRAFSEADEPGTLRGAILTLAESLERIKNMRINAGNARECASLINEAFTTISWAGDNIESTMREHASRQEHRSMHERLYAGISTAWDAFGEGEWYNLPKHLGDVFNLAVAAGRYLDHEYSTPILIGSILLGGAIGGGRALVTGGLFRAGASAGARTALRYAGTALGLANVPLGIQALYETATGQTDEFTQSDLRFSMFFLPFSYSLRGASWAERILNMSLGVETMAVGGTLAYQDFSQGGLGGTFMGITDLSFMALGGYAFYRGAFGTTVSVELSGLAQDAVIAGGYQGIRAATIPRVIQLGMFPYTVAGTFTGVAFTMLPVYELYQKIRFGTVFEYGALLRALEQPDASITEILGAFNEEFVNMQSSMVPFGMLIDFGMSVGTRYLQIPTTKPRIINFLVADRTFEKSMGALIDGVPESQLAAIEARFADSQFQANIAEIVFGPTRKSAQEIATTLNVDIQAARRIEAIVNDSWGFAEGAFAREGRFRSDSVLTQELANRLRSGNSLYERISLELSQGARIPLIVGSTLGIAGQMISSDVATQEAYNSLQALFNHEEGEDTFFKLLGRAMYRFPGCTRAIQPVEMARAYLFAKNFDEKLQAGEIHFSDPDVESQFLSFLNADFRNPTDRMRFLTSVAISYFSQERGARLDEEWLGQHAYYTLLGLDPYTAFPSGFDYGNGSIEPPSSYVGRLNMTDYFLSSRLFGEMADMIGTTQQDRVVDRSQVLDWITKMYSPILNEFMVEGAEPLDPSSLPGFLLSIMDVERAVRGSEMNSYYEQQYFNINFLRMSIYSLYVSQVRGLGPEWSASVVSSYLRNISPYELEGWYPDTLVINLDVNLAGLPSQEIREMGMARIREMTNDINWKLVDGYARGPIPGEGVVNPNAGQPSSGPTIESQPPP